MLPNLPTNATRRVAVSTLYQAVGKVVGIAFGVAGFALTSRALGPEQYGALATAVTYVSVFATFADLGLPILHLRLLALRKPSDQVRISNLHSLRLLTTVIVMGVGNVIAHVLPYGPAVQRGILIISIGFVAVSYTQYLLAIFQENLRTGRAAFAEVMGRGVMFMIVALAARLHWGFDAFMWASTVGSATAFLTSYFLALALWRPRLGWQPHTWPGLMREALPLILLTAFQIIYFKIDTLLLSFLSGNHAVGIYSAAYKFMDVFITFPALFSTLVLPFVARTATQPDQLRRIYIKALRAVVLVGLPLAIVTAVEGNRLVVLLSGQAFTEGGSVLRVLSLAVLPLFIGNLATTAMIGFGRAHAVAWIFGVAAVGGLAIYYPAILAWGYWGATAGTVAIEGSIAVAAFMYVRRFVGTLPLSPFVRAALAGAGYAGVALVARPLPLPAAIVIGIGTYAGLLFATGSVSFAEVHAATVRTYQA